jgi:hypothetical protein
MSAAITEKCSCGAEVTASGRGSADVVHAWRKGHRCTKPIPVPPGICGDQTDKDPTGRVYTCSLLYGHKGWHRYQDGFETVDWAWVLAEQP